MLMHEQTLEHQLSWSMSIQQMYILHFAGEAVSPQGVEYRFYRKVPKGLEALDWVLG